jgi:hypothetical protein
MASHPLYNSTALNSLPSAKTSGRVEAALVEFDINGKQEKPIWLFLANPASLKFSESADYGKVAPLASLAPTRHYNGASGAKLVIGDILMSTHCMGKTVLPLIEGARSLLRAKPEENKFAPPVLMFRWGKRRFGPCILTDLSWDESAWLDGDPAKAVMTMTLEEIPRPKTKAELEAKARSRAEDSEKKRKAQGKPPIKLTDRQRQEASDRAKEYLKTNRKSWAPDVQSEIDKGAYKLLTDAETGDVTLISKKGEKVGVVLRSLGDKEQSAGEKITTIPLAKDAKYPSLDIAR